MYGLFEAVYGGGFGIGGFLWEDLCKHIWESQSNLLVVVSDARLPSYMERFPLLLHLLLHYLRTGNLNNLLHLLDLLRDMRLQGMVPFTNIRRELLLPLVLLYELSLLQALFTEFKYMAFCT